MSASRRSFLGFMAAAPLVAPAVASALAAEQPEVAERVLTMPEALDAQREINRRRSKALHWANNPMTVDECNGD